MRASLAVAQFGTAATVLAVDLLTKALAVSLIPSDRMISVLGGHVTIGVERNAGAALSIGQDHTWLFTGILVAVIGVLFWWGRRSDSPLAGMGVGLVLGGALGNLGDRVFRAPGPFRGHVVDFLAIGQWPVFNVADVGIACGVAILAWRSAYGSPRAAPTPPMSDEPPISWSWVYRDAAATAAGRGSAGR